MYTRLHENVNISIPFNLEDKLIGRHQPNNMILIIQKLAKILVNNFLYNLSW